MCGIAGYSGLEDRALLQRMCDVQAHRGPDDEGQHHGKAVGLGNRRLAIVDIAGGHQPIHNEDESVWVTFNGEIYNHRDLREGLERLGHSFYTRSDTEVLVHAYEAWGDDFVARLNGIFAFGLHDAKRDKLLLARDQLGVKPLSYTFSDGALLFASEVKALLQHEGVKRELNREALFTFLNQSYVPGEDTLLRGIKRLLPAHLLIREDGKASVRRYWAPASDPVPGSEEHYVEAVKAALDRSVARELQGEVKIGVMLSGGMDSTALVALMSKHWQEPLHTYTINFGTEDDEGADARLVAEHFGTRHHELSVSKDSLELLPRLVWQMDEPRLALAPTYLLAQEARKDVKVLLSGLGGDELFLGYERDLRAYRTSRLSQAVPGPLRRAIAVLPTAGGALPDKIERIRDFMASGGDPAALYASFAPTGPLTGREQEEILADGLPASDRVPVGDVYRPYFEDLRGRDFVNQALIVQLRTYMAEDTLQIVDRMLAAHGVEGRVPFCNREVVELAFRMPLALKARKQKHILRAAMTRILPDPIVKNMRKRVFGHPAWHWFDGGMREIAARLLTRERAAKLGFFRYRWIERMLREPVDPRRERDYVHLWNIASFDVWHRLFIEGDPRKPRLGLEALV